MSCDKEIRRLGREAFFNYESQEDNPYHWDEPEHDWWFDGYYGAELESGYKGKNFSSDI